MSEPSLSTRSSVLRDSATLLAAALILTAGIALAIVGTREPPPPQFTGKVIDLLPSDEAMAGWTKKIAPIADAPEMRARVEEVLSYDDAVYCEYTKGRERISIYLAHWNPGKMPYRLIAIHTPDVCWTGAGWKTLSAESGVTFLANGHTVQPAERRTMQLGQHIEHVLFWHIVNGKARNYGTQSRPPWYAPLTDLFENRLNQRAEQWFIRVSSNQPEALLSFGVHERLLAIVGD